jgi:UDP-2,3-diacylglucosamine hydrolase
MTATIHATPNQKIYLLSDFHLGAPDYATSLVREKKVVAFLQSIEDCVAAVFIVGDIFDFWFEYKQVVPKGFVRLLGQIAKLTDKGVPVHIFTGNHDLWMQDYFETELKCQVHHGPQVFNFNTKTCYIAHGDGLGPGDKGYKFIKKIFTNRLCKWLFKWAHPDVGVSVANYFSRKSRAKTGNADAQFLGEDKEWLICYSKDVLQKAHYDYLIFGHRHFPLDLIIGESHYINLGDWINNFTYASFDGINMEIDKWESAS